MIKLDRSGITAPSDWQARYEGKLPDPTLFNNEAARFEALPVNDPSRRAGFATFAPTVLPSRVVKGKIELYFPECWTDADIRNQIRPLSGHRCAWCQSQAETIRSEPRVGRSGRSLQPKTVGRVGDVEHVHPKNLFPSLAYYVGNYLLSCTLCNQLKSDKWPTSHAIFRPDLGDPEPYLEFEEDGSMRGTTVEAQWVVDELKLDAEELRRERRLAIAPRMLAVRSVLGLPLSDGEKRVFVRSQLAGVADLYGGAINYCLRKEWKVRMPGIAL